MLDGIKQQRNRIVVHFKDGNLVKGYTLDFTSAKEFFHIISETEKDKPSIHEIWIRDLKAIFFVKQLDGNKNYYEKKEFEEGKNAKMHGVKVKVEFSDGEIIRGKSFAYNKAKKGFFVIPVDPESNNDRIYIVRDATNNVEVGTAALD